MGGVAVVKVGAFTEAELKEKKARVEDALNATRAAAKEGVVVGGGIALIRAEAKLGDLSLQGDQALGADVVRAAITAPLMQIAENAGLEGPVVLSRVREKKGDFGFNAATDEYGDLVKEGIIVDPVMVVRSALQNAVSVAGMLITTEAGVTEKPAKKPEAPVGGAGGGEF